MKYSVPISVVMSVYKEPIRWIDQSINSILNQTFRDFEFIIINDNFSDFKLKVYLEEKKKKYKKIVLLHNKTNLGLTKSLIKGVEVAKGRYIARMDADDISLPDRLRIQHEYMKNYSDCFLVFSGKKNIDKDGNTLKTFYPKVRPESIINKLIKKNIICHSSILFKNDNTISYREKFTYSQDYDFYLQAISNRKSICGIPQILVKYRIDANAISFSEKSKQMLFAEKAREFYYQRKLKGKDDYLLFNPENITSISILNTKNPRILRSEIKNNFLFSDFTMVRRICIRYFRLFGFFNSILLYFIFSFFGNTVINYFRNLNFYDQISKKQLKR